MPIALSCAAAWLGCSPPDAATGGGGDEPEPFICTELPGCGDCVREADLGERCDPPDPVTGACTPQCRRGFEVLFDERTVPRFYLTIPAASWDVMETCDGNLGADRPPECGYHAATFRAVYEPAPGTGSWTTTAVMPVGVRRKGRFTWRELGPPDPTFTGSTVVDRRGKPSLKLKFDFEDGERLLGLTRLTLNNGRQDPSGVRERLGYRIYRAAGVPAPLANSAELFVKGPDDADFVRWGLYVNVQSIDKRFIDFQFGERDGDVGNLYDTHNDHYFTDLDRCASREQAGEGAGAQEARFSLETNGSKADTSDLTAAIDAVYEPGCQEPGFHGDALLADLEPILDVDAFLRQFAVGAWIVDWDGFAGARNNYALYHEPLRDRFVVIPWGIDQTFGWQDQVHYPNWHYRLNHGASGRVRAHLMKRCAADVDGCWTRYLEHVEDVAETLADLDLASEAADMRAQIRGLVDWTTGEFDTHHSYLQQFLAARGSCVTALLAGGACAALECPVEGASCDGVVRP